MSRPARQAVGFLTVLGGPAVPTPAAGVWFPAVGAALGGVLGAAWWASARWWPHAVAAGLVVAADLALTGLLHADGLADSADGLLPHLAVERRLDVMAAPDVGAFGVVALVIVLLLRWAALASMAARPLVLVALWALSRTVMAVVPAVVTYARGEGLASRFRGASPWPPLVAGAVLSLGAAAVAGWPALVAVAAAVAAALGVVRLAIRRLGGFTGDVLGAAGLVAETVGLIVASARWPGW